MASGYEIKYQEFEKYAIDTANYLFRFIRGFICYPP
jgi:hypothetical protein